MHRQDCHSSSRCARLTLEVAFSEARPWPVVWSGAKVGGARVRKSRRKDAAGAANAVLCKLNVARRDVEVGVNRARKRRWGWRLSRAWEACSAFTHVTACTLAESPKRPFTPRAPTALLPPLPPRLLGWSEPVPVRQFHPLESSAFHGALLRQPPSETSEIVIGFQIKLGWRIGILRSSQNVVHRRNFSVAATFQHSRRLPLASCLVRLGSLSCIVRNVIRHAETGNPSP